MTGIEPAMARALDRLDPPPMSDDFTARVMAAAEGSATPLPTLPKSRPASRGLWRRSRNLVIGVTALSLVSAAAAATGLLGDRARDLPVISVIAAKIAPHRKSAPAKAQLPAQALAAAPAAVAPVQPETAASPAAPVEPPASVQQARREAVQKWVDARRERRAAQGLPVASPRAVAAVRERLAQMPPAERREIVRNALAARREAVASTGPGAGAAISAHPLRDAIVQRREAAATGRVSAPEAATQPDAAPVPSASPDAAASASAPARQQQTAERLRQLRELREHRRELRRQRGT